MWAHRGRFRLFAVCLPLSLSFVGADVLIRPPRYSFFVGAAPCGRPDERFYNLNGKRYFAPGRVTFCADRKSPKSCLGEGGFRFPPSLREPIPLKRPIRGPRPPIGCTPRGWRCPESFSGEPTKQATKRAGRCSPGTPVRLTDCFRQSRTRSDSGASTRALREGWKLGASLLVEVGGCSTDP